MKGTRGPQGCVQCGAQQGVGTPESRLPPPPWAFTAWSLSVLGYSEGNLYSLLCKGNGVKYTQQTSPSQCKPLQAQLGCSDTVNTQHTAGRSNTPTLRMNRSGAEGNECLSPQGNASVVPALRDVP